MVQELSNICDHGGHCTWSTIPIVTIDGNIRGNQCKLELLCYSKEAVRERIRYSLLIYIYIYIYILV